jgi:hypothetical protein
MSTLSLSAGEWKVGTMEVWSRIVLEQFEANSIQFGLFRALGARNQGQIGAKEGVSGLFRIVI